MTLRSRRYIAALMTALLTSVSVAAQRFGHVENLGFIVNSQHYEGYSSISSDGLTLFLVSSRPEQFFYFGQNLWVSTRQKIGDRFGRPVFLPPPVNLRLVTTISPSISPDGLTLYFSSDRGGHVGERDPWDIWMTTRDTVNDPWQRPVNLGEPVNTEYNERCPTLTADGLTLVYDSTRPDGQGGRDLWMAKRERIKDPWSNPINLGPVVNTSADEMSPSISADGLTLFFASNRAGGYGGSDLWMTRRTSRDDVWGKPTNLGPDINTSSNDDQPNISFDGRILYFASDRPGGFGVYDLYRAILMEDAAGAASSGLPSGKKTR